MERLWSFSIRSFLFAVFVCWSLSSISSEEIHPRFLVTRESRRTIVSTESGEITAVDLHDENRGVYHLQFITLDTSSLFLPVLLHTDMVFYVLTGSGTVTWIGDDGTERIDVGRGDIYRLEEGTAFYVQSHHDPNREKLRIHAIFNPISDMNPLMESLVGPYSNVSDLVLGFEEKVLQMGFRVSEEIVREIKQGDRPPSIVRFEPKNETDADGLDWKEGIFEALIGGRQPIVHINGKKKKSKAKTFNIFKRKPDVKNCNGWSTAVTNKDFRALGDANIGVFMVNLTKGSMMGPHWNPKATEFTVVTHGQGVVQVVCPSNPSGQSGENFQCRNSKFKVKEGDMFIVPRFHPMVQISYNNDSFVFMGFSNMASKNHPQFVPGQRSVLRTIDRSILAISFGTTNTTIDRFLDSQKESIMLECTSCAEELERKIEEEIKREKQEEEARREKEEAKRREEEEARRREEEEMRKREEEARKREEEEARRREEEARKREEEEARRREEEARKREEEKEARERQEEARKREEEEAREREEEARKREEEKEARERQEEARKREEEEAREREEEARKKEEEEEARRREEKEERRKEREEARRREEEEESRRREKEERREEARRREEEARKKEEEEEARERQEEARKEEEEEARRKEEKARKREEEEEARRKEEKARKREEEEEARRREEKEGRRKEEEEETRRKQEEEATRSKREERRREEEEEAKREEEEARRKEEEEEEERQRQIQEEEEKETRRKEKRGKEEGERWGERGMKLRKIWRV